MPDTPRDRKVARNGAPANQNMTFNPILTDARRLMKRTPEKETDYHENSWKGPEDGGPQRDRTSDLVIKSHLLYQLS